MRGKEHIAKLLMITLLLSFSHTLHHAKCCVQELCATTLCSSNSSTTSGHTLHHHHKESCNSPLHHSEESCHNCNSSNSQNQCQNQLNYIVTTRQKAPEAALTPILVAIYAAINAPLQERNTKESYSYNKNRNIAQPRDSYALFYQPNSPPKVC